jgi:hypothetical protein
MPDRPPLQRLRQSLRHARIALPMALLGTPLAHADINAALERMEPGSVIKDLLIPRYDENKKASLVLRADRLVVETLKNLSAENLTLHLITSETNEALNGSWFSIESCRYDINNSMLRSESAVDAISANYLLRSQGLITKIESGQSHFTAFLLPPVYGYINLDSNQTSAMTRTRQSLLLASLLATQAVAQEPAPPADAYFALTPRSQEIDAQLQEFAKTHAVQIAAVPLPVAPAASLKPVAPVIPMPQFVPAADALGFACKGGVFYDSKTASLTLLRDVTVRNPAYAMTVQGEVKVFFEPEVEKKKTTPDKKDEAKPEEPKQEEPKPEEAKKPEKKKSSENSLGKVKQMLGTGGVAFEAIDKDGVKNYASGDTVVYEVAKEEILLKGKKLMFQQGTQSRFASASPDAWLRFNLKTKNFDMSDGWNAQLSLPPKEDPKKKPVTPNP